MKGIGTVAVDFELDEIMLQSLLTHKSWGMLRNILNILTWNEQLNYTSATLAAVG